MGKLDYKSVIKVCLYNVTAIKLLKVVESLLVSSRLWHCLLSMLVVIALRMLLIICMKLSSALLCNIMQPSQSLVLVKFGEQTIHTLV